MDRLKRRIKEIETNDIKPYLFCVPDVFVFNERWTHLLANSFSIEGAVSLARVLTAISNVFEDNKKQTDYEIDANCDLVFKQALKLLRSAFSVYRTTIGFQPVIVCLPTKFEHISFWIERFNKSTRDLAMAKEISDIIRIC